MTRSEVGYILISASNSHVLEIHFLKLSLSIGSFLVTHRPWCPPYIYVTRPIFNLSKGLILSHLLAPGRYGRTRKEKFLPGPRNYAAFSESLQQVDYWMPDKEFFCGCRYNIIFSCEGSLPEVWKHPSTSVDISAKNKNDYLLVGCTSGSQLWHDNSLSRS